MLQDDLGYSALTTGVRMLMITGASLVAATVAGRASSQVPVRWLIGPVLALVGFGLLLMAGLDGTSSWTHLAAGFFVAGITRPVARRQRHFGHCRRHLQPAVDSQP